VISVDTMVAHLAGALGVPTWTLLATPTDWRWMDARPDTPWYPSMRLLRQPSPGDWPAVMRTLREALARRL
jgi:ADP-heptose:LPS heptosyltransferase